MRLSEDKIKEAILHIDPEVREMAVRYFADSFSPDPTIMPLVIQAVGKYGRGQGISLFALRQGLVQTDETLQWLMSEFAREGDPGDEKWRRYCLGLNDLLTETDAHLLAKYELAILDIEGLDLSVREVVKERVALLLVEPAVCWTRLHDFCEREKTKQYTNEVDLPHAFRLVEAIARHGEEYAEPVMAILAEKVEDFNDNPMAWLEPLAVRLAGEMRLEAAIPLIVGKLHEEEGDLLAEECERALWKIGNDAVVEAVCTGFAQAEWHYRLFGASVLENIHSDLTVTKCLELLPQEEDADLRVWLGKALLRQLSFEGIEPLRQLILRGPLDGEMLELRNNLLTACTLMDATIPEFEAWKKDSEHDEKMRKAFLAKGRPTLKDDYWEDEDDEDEPPARQKVGRNDPCPCGSGKKFKKCCLRKGS